MNLGMSYTESVNADFHDIYALLDIREEQFSKQVKSKKPEKVPTTWGNVLRMSGGNNVQ